MDINALQRMATALNLCRASVDSSGNVRGIQAGNGPVLQLKKHRQNIFTKCPGANLAVQAAYGGYTTGIQTQLGARPIAVRIGVWNADTTGTSAIKASFGFDTVMGAVNSSRSQGANVPSWTNVTWGGATSGTIAQPASAINPTILFSDWMGCSAPLPTDGTIYPILHMRLLQGAGAGNATWFNSAFWAPSTTTEGPSLGGTGPVSRTTRMYRSNAAADYTTVNQSTLNSACTNAVPAAVNFIVQYMTVEQGVTIATIGDSIFANCAVATVLTANGWGWTARAVEALHSAGLPVEFANFGWSGQTSAQYAARFAVIAPYLSNVLLCPELFSPNDYQSTPSSPANSQALMTTSVSSGESNVGLILALANQYNMTPLLQSSLPANAPIADGGTAAAGGKQYWLGDQIRLAETTRYAASGQYFFDAGSVLAGSVVTSGNAAGQTQYASGMSASIDNLHPNDVGQTAWAAAFAAYVRPLL